MIFPLKLTCLRDVCFQGGPSHVPESLKSDTGAYRQWHPAEGCTRYPCSSDRRSTYVCYRYVVHLPFRILFLGRPHMYATKKKERKRSSISIHIASLIFPFALYILIAVPHWNRNIFLEFSFRLPQIHFTVITL